MKPLLLLFSFNAFAYDAACIRALASFFQQGTVGVEIDLKGRNPFKTWMDQRRDQSREPHYPVEEMRAFQRQFEDAIIQLIDDVAPEFRGQRIRELARKYSFSEEQLRSAVDYYATHIYEDARILGQPARVQERLSELHRALRLVPQVKGSAQTRYYYYLNNLTHRSIPEMAAVLGMKEGQVYSEIMHMGISIYHVFGSVLPEAKRLVASGVSVAEVARRLEVGEQALTFILHYDQEIDKGVPWTRQLRFGEELQSEEAIAVALREQGRSEGDTRPILTLQEIADKINELAETRDPSHPDYRTAGAIAARFRLLGVLPERQSTYPKNVEIPGYGFVKKNGFLQVEPAKKFILDNAMESMEWLQQRLGVDQSSFRRFLDRHDIVLFLRPRRGDTRGKAEARRKLAETLERHAEERRQAFERFAAEGGGLKYFADTAKWSMFNPERKLTLNAREWLKNLLAHLPKEERDLFEAKILVDQLPHTLGTNSRNALSDAVKVNSQKELFMILVHLVEAHNQAVFKNGETPGYYSNRLPLRMSDLESPEGMAKILRELRGQREFYEILPGFQTQGYEYFRDIIWLGKNNPEIQFDKGTRQWTRDLLVHLPAAEREFFESKIKIDEMPVALGMKSKNKGIPQTQIDSTQGEVMDVLFTLIEAHNQAVSKNANQPGYYPGRNRIEKRDLATAEGLEKALAILRGEEALYETALKFRSEGRKYFNRTTQLKSASPEVKLTSDAREWVTDLVSFLPKAERDRFHSKIHVEEITKLLGQFVRPASEERENINSRRQLFRVLHELIESHNQAVAKNAAAPGYYPDRVRIEIRDLESPEGVERVLKELRGETKFNESLNVFRSGGVKYFLEPGAERMLLHNTPEWVRAFIHRFPASEREWFSTQISVESLPKELPIKRNRSANEQRSSQTALFSILRALIESHNRAVAKNETTPGYYPNRKPIPLSALDTVQGVKEALEELKEEINLLAKKPLD